MAHVGSPMSSRSQVGILPGLPDFPDQASAQPGRRDGAPKTNPSTWATAVSLPISSTLHPQEHVSPELSST